MRKKKMVTEAPFTENYTIFHALFEAAKDRENENKKPTSLLHRLNLHK